MKSFRYSLVVVILGLSGVVGLAGDIPHQDLPVGIIAMWSGSASDLPAGWALCDGNNGTPDLRDKFIVGAGSTYAMDDVGGSATADLQHHHGGNTGAGTAHTHCSGSYVTDSYMHMHGPGTLTTGPPNVYEHADLTIGVVGFARKHTHSVISGTTTSDSHSHVVIGTSGSESAHTHPVTDDLSSEQSILPPYYALAYIIYVGDAPVQTNDWQFLPQIRKAAMLWLN